MTSNIPAGTVTFLFTDIEGSTKLAQEHRDQWEGLRQRHHAILQSAMDVHNGYVFQIIGDTFCVAFHTAADAVNAAIDSQCKLQTENWCDTPIKVRMGIHTGEARIQSNGDYQGYLTLSRVQRLMSAGHGGQILISHATQELVRDELPKDVSLRDLGERRLKDLIRPEHIYQFDITGLPVEFPALKTLDKYRHNLPVQLISFIGREKEMAEIKTALNEHRLVTLTGSGGVGKTRLSLQVAADLLDSFPNGIWFVELASITDPDLIPQTILSAADMQTQPGRSALDSLKEFLREKTSLVVLDNCEHLIEACAKLANTLLSSTPNLKIFASSREALGVQGERAWHVPSLSIPDIKHLPAIEQLSQYEAVRLFIERAKLVQQNFVITDDNASTVAQICFRLDGIPLAIELAAARVKVLKPEQIAERLNDRFRLLTGGSRTALPRQQTLLALIDWSYDLLSDNEKLLIRRLSVFMGGWTLEAAEQVCADVGQNGILSYDVLDLLTHLVDKSLVVIDEQSTQLRYRMLETVRQYAREKLLESGEGEKLRTRHLSYFLKFAEEAEPHLFRTEQIEWFERLELDHENLRAALEWILNDQQEDPSETGLRLSNALWWFWIVRGYQLDGNEWYVRALKANEKVPRTMARSRALVRLGRLMELREEARQAIKLFDEGIDMCRELGDKSSLASALVRKGRYLFYFLKDPSMAKTLIAESLSIYRDLDDTWGIATALFASAEVIEGEYDYPAERQYYEASLQAFQAVGDRRGMAYTLNKLGVVAMNLGDWSEARGLFEKSLSLSRELGEKAGISMWLSNLGYVSSGMGNFAQAEKLLEESLVIAKDLGSRSLISRVQDNLGHLAFYRGDHEQAFKIYSENLVYSQALGEEIIVVLALIFLSKLARLQGDYIKARSYCSEAIATAKKIIGDLSSITIIDCLEEFAALSAVQEQAKRAAMLFGAAETLREQIHSVLVPVEKIEVDKNIASARAQLDESTFNAAWAEGRAMTMEQVIAYALE